MGSGNRFDLELISKWESTASHDWIQSLFISILRDDLVIVWGACTQAQLKLPLIMNATRFSRVISVCTITSTSSCRSLSFSSLKIFRIFTTRSTRTICEWYRRHSRIVCTYVRLHWARFSCRGFNLLLWGFSESLCLVILEWRKRKSFFSWILNSKDESWSKLLMSSSKQAHSTQCLIGFKFLLLLFQVQHVS